MNPSSSQSKQRAALLSISASGALVAIKFTIAFLTGSLALLTEALHSLLDLGAAMMTYFAVNWADRPADATHHYGHGKIESLTALFEVVLLLFVAAFASFEALDRLSGHPHAVDAAPAAIVVILVSILVDFFRARALQRTAKETASPALEADSLHFTSDMLASFAALAGLVGIALGFTQADAIAALAVAVIILFISFGITRRTLGSLLDAAPRGSRELVAHLASSISGVANVERVRIRDVGGQMFCEISIQVARSLPLQRVDEIREEVARAVHRALPRADVTVTADAIALAEETVMERVTLIAARQHALIHHLTVQRLDDHLAIALDLEVNETMPLVEAHAAATRLEAALRDEFGSDTEVETHIEPLQDWGFARKAPEHERQKLESDVKRLATAHPQLQNVHSLRLRHTKAGSIVILHCYVEPRLSVRAVHEAVDALERELRISHPAIVRVLIHAEPESEARNQKPENGN